MARNHVKLEGKMMDGKPVLTVEETAEVFGISRGLAYEGVKDGSIPSIRIGKRILVPRARIAEMLGETKPKAA